MMAVCIFCIYLFKKYLKCAVKFFPAIHFGMLLLPQLVINILHLLLVTFPRLVILELILKERVVGTILQLRMVEVLR